MADVHICTGSATWFLLLLFASVGCIPTVLYLPPSVVPLHHYTQVNKGKAQQVLPLHSLSDLLHLIFVRLGMVYQHYKEVINTKKSLFQKVGLFANELTKVHLEMPQFITDRE